MKVSKELSAIIWENIIRNEALSQRDIQAVELLARGLTNDEIGARLKISGGTVKAYIFRVMKSFKVKNRAELILKLCERPAVWTISSSNKLEI